MGSHGWISKSVHYYCLGYSVHRYIVSISVRQRTENARVALVQDEYTERYNGLVSRYEMVRAQYDEVTQAFADKAHRKKLLEQFLHTVETQKPIAGFDERLWSSLVNFVTVYSEKDICVTFKDGTEIQTQENIM